MAERTDKPCILLLGPSLAAVSGVSTHLNQLLSSRLGQEYRLEHFQVGSEGRNEMLPGRLWRLVSSPLLLAWRLIKRKPDIVHLNLSFDHKSLPRDMAYALVSKLLGRRVVCQVHGGCLPGDYAGDNRLIRSLLNRLFGMQDAIVLLAERERRAYQSLLDIRLLRVIPNAIDMTPYEGGGDKCFDADCLRLVYIGRLAADKGIGDSIEALAILEQRGLTALDLEIAGTGPAEQELRELTERLGLGARVRFTGPLFGEQKTTFWKQASIFVFPTYHYEGLPYTVLESLASGTPLVTTRMGGIQEAVGDGVHGILVEPHDPVAVADAIQAMVTDRNALGAMSAACREQARRHYGINRMAEQFSGVYRDVLTGITG